MSLSTIIPEKLALDWQREKRTICLWTVSEALGKRFAGAVSSLRKNISSWFQNGRLPQLGLLSYRRWKGRLPKLRKFIERKDLEIIRLFHLPIIELPKIFTCRYSFAFYINIHVTASKYFHIISSLTSINECTVETVDWGWKTRGTGDSVLTAQSQGT